MCWQSMAAPQTAAIPVDYKLKILLIGPSGVGKTCILSRFCNDVFDERVNTTIGGYC